LLDNKIALRDIYLCGERDGSSDLNIKNGKPNDIAKLLRKYPNIGRIIFDSKTAEKIYYKYFSDVNIEKVYVPSPSSACPKPLDEKIQMWGKALKIFDNIK